MKTLQSIVALFLLVLASSSFAAVWPDIQVSWTEPTTRADGSKLLRTEIKEYKIFMRAPGATTFAVLTAVKGEDKANYAHTFKPATQRNGEHCFYLTTVDTKSLESVPSANFCVPYAQMHEPNPPTTIRVTITLEAGAAQ